ncbi:hypothetical protein D4R54_02170 [archaeon]|jgi:hypothetical protein|nr:MAG: hypothetical protein D4R54_02170 [archaeon]
MIPIFHRKIMKMPEYTAKSRTCNTFLRIFPLVLENPIVNSATSEHSQSCPHSSYPEKYATALVNEVLRLASVANVTFIGRYDWK